MHEVQKFGEFKVGDRVILSHDHHWSTVRGVIESIDPNDKYHKQPCAMVRFDPNSRYVNGDPILHSYQIAPCLTFFKTMELESAYEARVNGVKATREIKRPSKEEYEGINNYGVF